MNDVTEYISIEQRMNGLIEDTTKNLEKVSQQRRQKDRIMILQEKDVVKSLKSMREKSSHRTKNFFKVGIAIGVATLGLSAVAPAVAIVAGFGAAFSLIKANSQLKHTKNIAKDERIAKRNVNTMLVTLKGGKAGVYQITQRIAECRKNMMMKDFGEKQKNTRISY